eukprot:TRINITY_DN4807_c0_g1_i2.p1 TRINITY_DN4807_c0_g1~~TRINITY_DN4807_c0_g1_i2.p1  ORF type:complete len:128 (+),score=11.63 TRINITY_DN4807_c0_g1_i2:454-837(+)
MFCLSADAEMIGELITKIVPIKPYIYATNLKNPDSINNMFASGALETPNTQDLFTYKNLTINGMPAKFIFKNGAQNGSIFEDGINNMLQSSLLAETWGRPLQAPWCGSPYSVGNIKLIQFNSQVYWK